MTRALPSNDLPLWQESADEKYRKWPFSRACEQAWEALSAVIEEPFQRLSARRLQLEMVLRLMTYKLA